MEAGTAGQSGVRAQDLAVPVFLLKPENATIPPRLTEAPFARARELATKFATSSNVKRTNRVLELSSARKKISELLRDNFIHGCHI